MDDVTRFRVDEIEYLLLGAALSEPGALAAVRARLAPGDFGLPGHGAVWEVLGELADAGRPLDLAALLVALEARGTQRAVAAQVRLRPLPFMPATLERVEDWARIVAANARARRTRRALAAALAKFDRPGVGPEDFAAAARDAVVAAADEGEAPGEAWLDDEMDGVQAGLEHAAEHGPSPSGLASGLTRLDQLIGGFRAGQVVIVAGRTGQGKTAFATTVALNVALSGAAPVLVASLEMTAEDMAGRAMAWLGGVSQARIRHGLSTPLAPAELERTSVTPGRIRRAVRLIADGDLGVADLRARARRLQAQHGLSLVIVDYLQLVRPEAAKGPRGSRERDVAEISRGLKRLALELRVPVLALSQLNRQADERETPVLADLRESGSIEHDASAVVFLWPTDREDVARVIVAKSRFGPCGEFRAKFVRHLTRFEDLGPEDAPATARYGRVYRGPSINTHAHGDAE